MAGISLTSIPAAYAVGVTDAMIEKNADSGVLSWGMGQQGQRYSKLVQINTKTVGKLTPAWSFSFGGEKQRVSSSSQATTHA